LTHIEEGLSCRLAAVVIKELARLLVQAQIVRAPRYQENLSFRMPDSLVICF